MASSPPAKPLGRSLPQPGDGSRRGLALAGSALALAGLGVSAYLTYAHYTTPQVLACSDSGVINCAKVTTSTYSEMLGVPVAVSGLIYFAVMLAAQSAWSWRSRLAGISAARAIWSVTGLVFVAWLIRAEVHLGAICIYCTIVHIITVAIAALTFAGSCRGWLRNRSPW